MGTALRSVERSLFIIAALCLLYVGVTLTEATHYRTVAREFATARPPAGETGQTIETTDIDEPAAPATARVTTTPAAKRAVKAARSAGLIGELAIPHLGISTAILEGDGWQALRRGAGHLPGTPLPGAQGNTVLAGHRDTVFRRLAELQRGDRVRVTTRQGTFNYRVSRTFRVAPKDVWVLDDGAAALTLITCYPFNWVGSAPERWIVQAESDSGEGTR